MHGHSILLGLASLVLDGPDATDSPVERGPRTLFGREVEPTREPSADEIARRKAALAELLRATDSVQVGDRVVPRAVAEGRLEDVPHREFQLDDPPHRATIFLNFFGGQLAHGTNAAAMESNCVTGTIDYPAYSGNEQFALAVIQVFENALAPYGVRVAYEEAPPAHLPYSMVMMGGQSSILGLEGGTLGVSCSSDCGDFWWRDTTFAFTEGAGVATTLGNTALQEAAHAFGLDHIDGNQHIMYPYAGGGVRTWADACTNYNTATGGTSCTYVHDAFCGDGAGQQHDTAELMAFFGPNSPDTQAPAVTITEPSDGASLPGGLNVTIAAEVSDDHEGFGWKLVIESQGEVLLDQPAVMFEESWSLALPDGAYVVRIEAIDHDRNQSSDAVAIVVGEGELPGTDDGGSGSAEASDGGGSEETGGSTTADENDGGGSCGCVAADGLAYVGPLVFPAWVRRRRRR